MTQLIRTLALLTALFGHALASTPRQDVAPSEQVRIRTLFERHASELPYLSLDSVLWDRERGLYSSSVPPLLLEQHTRILRQVTDPAHPMQALLALLSHPSPKVRTLAAVALFDRNDPSVLPRLHELREDAAVSFEAHIARESEGPGNAGGFVRSSGMPPPQGTLSVGGVANAMVHFYLRDCDTGPDFPKYWELHGGRSSCVCWFEVQARRAYEGSSSRSADCARKLALLRARIGALEPEGQLWTWLALWTPYGNKGTQEQGLALAPQAQLIALCHEVGAERLMQALRAETISDDPDLGQRKRNWSPRRSIAVFLLTHAKQVLRAQDSDELLVLGALNSSALSGIKTVGLRGPLWRSAATSLRSPESSASESTARAFHSALAHFDGEADYAERAALNLGLWEHCGDSQLAFLLDRLLEPSANSHVDLAVFSSLLANTPRGRELLAHILRDARLDEVGQRALLSLGKAVEDVSGAALLEDLDRQGLRRYRGPPGYSPPAEEERARLQALEARMVGLRRRLLESIPSWEMENANDGR